MMVGLTIVAFGTSAPELVVSSAAALRGESGLAIGNIMGSTVANVGLIVGLGAFGAVGRLRLAGSDAAIDAAVATNLVLGVVAPYTCGLGGDLLAIVWDGRTHGYRSIGRLPGRGLR